MGSDPPPSSSSHPRVSTLIIGAFELARARQRASQSLWVKTSWKIGGRLPHSALLMSVQRDAEVDLVLRCMEDDHTPTKDNEIDLSYHYQKMLSDLWIGSMYETYRLMIERKVAPNDDRFRQMAHDLRLLRIALEKHEIAADKKITEPLKMRRMPPTGQDRNYYTYSLGDPLKAHIMPAGISPRASMMWQVLDMQSGQERWIERRDLSDRIIGFWSSEEVLGIGQLEAQKKSSEGTVNDNATDAKDENPHT
jgi:hypothetical protein